MEGFFNGNFPTLRDFTSPWYDSSICVLKCQRLPSNLGKNEVWKATCKMLSSSIRNHKAYARTKRYLSAIAKSGI